MVQQIPSLNMEENSKEDFDNQISTYEYLTQYPFLHLQGWDYLFANLLGYPYAFEFLQPYIYYITGG
jgi:hypothetical protein